MPFEIIRNDIANVTADVIVNTANPHPVVGPGTDAAIHQKAGPALLEARNKIGDIPVGHCAITPAFDLNGKYVIHTVGPVWQGGKSGEAALLESCYQNSLDLAVEYGCSSIAFPLISAGAYGFPRGEALQIAVKVFSTFLMKQDMHIYLVVWDRDSFQLSKGLFETVRSYIDENYIQEKRESLFSYASERSQNRPPTDRGDRDAQPKAAPKRPTGFFSVASLAPCAPAPRAKETFEKVDACSVSEDITPPMSLDQLLENTDAGFTETLLKLIDQTGKKDSEIYKKANVSKQHFSKIRNNPDYKPTKATALAFAIALELDLQQTRDLIGRAGYALTNSSKFDVIIMYFISHKNYDMFDINMTLFRFDQMTLGV